MSEMVINGRKLKLSNLDKVYWADKGYTKKDLLSFYIKISPYLLPYLQNRPCTFQRFPDGIGGKKFYQKNAPAFTPDWVKTYEVKHGEKKINYILVNNLETLVFLVNLACLEFHPYHSRIEKIKNPGYGVVDLDPQEGVGFDSVLETALAVKGVVSEYGLKCYPKTSGSSGVQVYIPVAPRYSYESVRELVRLICLQVKKKLPEQTTMERMVAKRGQTIYLDYLQNGRGKTINAVYTVRPKPQATVSTPLTWPEIAAGEVRPHDFTIKSIFTRLQDKGDIFSSVLQREQKISSALHTLGRLGS